MHIFPRHLKASCPPAGVPGQSPSDLEIGKLYGVAGPDGTERVGKVTHALVAEAYAHAILYDKAANESFMATFPLSPEELADYHRHPDTFFGGYQKQGGKVETPIELFDFFFEAHRDTPREKLIEWLGGRLPDQDIERLSQKELAEIFSERMVLNAMATTGLTFPSPRKRQREGTGRG